MGENPIPMILLAAFDQSQINDVRKFKGDIQGNQEFEVLDFVDIQHVDKKDPYETKLRNVLNDVKLAILVTPSDDSAIKDSKKLVEVIKSIYKIELNKEASKTFLEFLSLESDANIESSKLVFLSIGEKKILPEAYRNVEHVNGILTKSEDGVNTNEDELRKLLTKCKKPARKTFPTETTKDVKKKDCSVM